VSRYLGLVPLLGLCWVGPALADCKAAIETRRTGLEEAVRLCSGAGHDALTCYDGARRFIRANEALLTHQDVLKCPDADVAALRSELTWARGLVNKKASEARRILLEQTLVDRLFVHSVNTLKAYVCMAIVNDTVAKDEKILPEYRHNVLVEETLPQTVAEGQQVIRFRSKSSGALCGFGELPAKSQLGNFEERLYFLTKERIAESGRSIAQAFLSSGIPMEAQLAELGRQFLSIVSDYQSKFEAELRRREEVVDAATLLSMSRPAKQAIFVEAGAPENRVIESDYPRAWEGYGRFLQWADRMFLK
jgi:hypothetical protein